MWLKTMGLTASLQGELTVTKGRRKQKTDLAQGAGSHGSSRNIPARGEIVLATVRYFSRKPIQNKSLWRG